MSYEQFRNDILLSLSDILPGEQVSRVLSVMDATATSYDISRKSMELSVLTDDLPQIVKIHIAAKAIENKSKATLSQRTYILRKFFSDIRMPFDKVTANDIRSYLFRYKKTYGVSDSTLDRIRSNLLCFYQWCVDEEYMQRNPAAKIATIKYQDPQVEPLTSLELEMIRSVCHDAREKAIVDLFYCTGCRVSELCDLLISDINFERLTVHIRHGKGDKERMSYLNAEAVISLKNYLSERVDNCPYLIVSERKPAHQVTTNAIRKMLKKLEKRTGTAIHLHPHKFRHTTATDALGHGMQVEQVQRLLGHSNIATTMRYAKVSQKDVQDAHRKYLA